MDGGCCPHSHGSRPQAQISTPGASPRVYWHINRLPMATELATGLGDYQEPCVGAQVPSRFSSAHSHPCRSAGIGWHFRNRRLARSGCWRTNTERGRKSHGRSSVGADLEAVAKRLQHSVGADLSAIARWKVNSLRDVRGQVRSHGDFAFDLCDTLLVR